MIERVPMPFMEWQIIQRVQMLLRQAKTLHLACRILLVGAICEMIKPRSASSFPVRRLITISITKQ